MKPFFLIIIIIITSLIVFYPLPSNSNSTGSIGGKTGSPGDGVSCTQCHYAVTANGAIIDTDIPIDGYIPGEIYTVTVNISQSGVNNFGFEITSEETNFGSAKKGVFFVTDNTETKLVNNNTAITHQAAGMNGTNNSKSWSFDWQAPGFASSTGSVTFYGAFIGANADGQNTGDTYHATTLTVNEAAGNSIDNIENQVSFNFNPNTKDIKLLKNEYLKIYNIDGKEVLSINEHISSLSDLSPGIYIVKSKNSSKKIIIH
tara:strand:+ start:1291 stop:2067 length:777 start_codon:yes stop_codon:yes gene_type:complete